MKRDRQESLASTKVLYGSPHKGHGPSLFCLFLQGTGSVDVWSVVAAAGPGRESTEGPLPCTTPTMTSNSPTQRDQFSGSKLVLPHLYKSMLEKSSSSQHGESGLGRELGCLVFTF